VWSKVFGGNPTTVARVTVDAANSILLAGDFNTALAFGGTMLTGNQQMFVAKLDLNGVPLWAQGFGTVTGNSKGTGIAADGMENVLVSGFFTGSMTFGGVVLTGPNSGSNAFVGKLSAGGTPLWGKSFGSNLDPAALGEARDIAVDGSGNVIVTGVFVNAVDFGCGPSTSVVGDGGVAGTAPFVAKLDTGGTCLWSQAFPFEYAQGMGVAVDDSNDVLVTGYFNGPDSIPFAGSSIMGAAMYNLFVVKLGADGTGAWGKGFGITGGTQGYRIAVDPTGNAFVTASLSGSVDLGGGALTSDGGFVIASFGDGGTYRWAKVFAGSPAPPAVATQASSRVLIAGETLATTDFGCGPLMPLGPKDGFVAELLQ
jgi:hypothetical protein